MPSKTQTGADGFPLSLGEPPLWEGRPSRWTYSRGDGRTVFFLFFVCYLIGLLSIAYLFDPNGPNDLMAAVINLLALIWCFFLMFFPFLFIIMRKYKRSINTRYLIFKNKVVIINPYSRYIFKRPTKNIFVFLRKDILKRELKSRWILKDIIFGMDVLYKEKIEIRTGLWPVVRSSYMETIIETYRSPIGFIDCMDWSRAEELLKEHFTDEIQEKDQVDHNPLLEWKEVLSGRAHFQPKEASQWSVFFLTGNRTPYRQLFRKIVRDPLHGMRCEEILGHLLEPDETVLWSGRPEASRFAHFYRIQQISGSMAIIVSIIFAPIFTIIWLNLILFNLKILIFLPLFSMTYIVVFYWGFNILFGRWSVKNIVGSAYYAITNQRVLLVHPFSSDLVPFYDTYHEIYPGRIENRILCQLNSGPALIFWHPQTNKLPGLPPDDFPAIVGCPDWADAELILREHFDENPPNSLEPETKSPAPQQYNHESRQGSVDKEPEESPGIISDENQGGNQSTV